MAGRRVRKGAAMELKVIQRELFSNQPDAQAGALRRVSRALSQSAETGDPGDRTALEAAGVPARVFELSSSEDPVVRELAADVLGYVGGERALGRLLELADDDEDRVRATATGQLACYPAESRARDGLLVALHNRDWSTRHRAVWGLRRFSDEECCAAVVEALADADANVRWAATESLDLHDPARVLALVVPMLDHPNPSTLPCAMAVLAKVGDAPIADRLARMGGLFNFAVPADTRRWARDAAKEIRARLKGKA